MNCQLASFVIVVNGGKKCDAICEKNGGDMRSRLQAGSKNKDSNYASRRDHVLSHLHT